MSRTLITGMGVWSCIGKNVYEVESSLRKGVTGIAVDSTRKRMGYQSPLTGLVAMPDLSCEGLTRAQRTCMSEAAKYAYMAVRQALDKRRFTDAELSRCGLIVSNDSSAEAMADTERIMSEYGDTRRLGAGMVFRTLNSTVSMNLAQIFQIGGLSFTISAACAGGGHAVGVAHKLIQSGVLDACVVVGAQEVNSHAFTSFDALGIFSRNVDDYEHASRPFDRSRDGLVPSGGAACVILESSSHYEMSASVHDISDTSVVVQGYGFSTSPNIVTPSAEEECAAMGNALVDSGLFYDDLQLIMAHATSTVDGDLAEAQALRLLRNRNNSNFMPHVVCTKALTGHECWMSGVSQIVYAAIQMRGGFYAAYPHFAGGRGDTSLLPIRRECVECGTIRHALCNSFGFGGTNASIVLGLI